MKILTFQHRDVLNEIKEKGIYIANIESKWSKLTPVCYSLVFDSIKLKEKEATRPIFGWYKAIRAEEDIQINNKTLSRCLEMVPFDDENHYLYVLDIEEEKLSLQDFYSFVDARCEEEDFDAYYEGIENFPKECIFNIEKAIETQCTFSAIKKENLKEVYEYKKHGANNCTFTKIN